MNSPFEAPEAVPEIDVISIGGGGSGTLPFCKRGF